MEVASLQLKIQTDQVTKGVQELDKLTNAGQRAERATDSLATASGKLQQALAGLGIAFGAQQIIKISDDYLNLNGRLQLVTNSTEEFHRVQKALFDTAQSTRTELSGTVDLYTRLTRSTESLNTTEKDRLAVTKTINQSLIVSGASASSAAAALVQLGQGFASGTLRGEELNSVLEQTPRLAQAIAEGMGVTVGQLRDMGKAGQLTSEAVFNSLKNQAGALQAEFDKMPHTVGQSITQLQNQFQQFIGQTNEANGTTKILTSAIDLVSRNLDVLTAAAAGFGAMKLGTMFLDMTSAVQKNIVATINQSAAQATQNASAVAAAQATVTLTSAKAAELTATRATITAAREEQVVKLQSVNANIAAAQSAIAAAEGAGAQSAALAALRTATTQLAAAEQARAVILAELAVLGTQNARVSAALTAATEAQAVAQAGLNTVSAAGAAGAGILGRAVGLLGGPIGLITTALGLGVTAWQLWGSSAKQGEAQAKTEVESSTSEILTNLDKQIKKLEERNRLVASGVPSSQADSPAVQKLASLRQQIQEAMNGEGAYKGLNMEGRVAAAATLGAQYNELTQKVERLNQATAVDNSNKQKKSLANWMKTYATTAENLKDELAKAAADFDGKIPAELEKRIREHFAETEKKGSKAKKEDKAPEAIQGLKDQIAMTAQLTELDRVSELIAVGKYGKITEAEAAELKSLAIILDAKKYAADFEQREKAAYEAKVKALDTSIESLKTQNQDLAAGIELIGLDEKASNALALGKMAAARARKEEALAAAQERGEKAEIISRMRDEIDLMREKEILTGQRNAKQETAKEQEDLMRKAEQAREKLATSIEDGILNGFRKGKSIADIFIDELKAQFAKTILRPIIQPIADAGSSIISNLLGKVAFAALGAKDAGQIVDTTTTMTKADMPDVMRGGRAWGGSVSANSLYQVNETGDAEVFSQGGKDYLMTGSAGGKVVPAGQVGGTTIQITNAPVISVDSRTDQAVIYSTIEKALAVNNAQLVEKLERSRKI